ncbi:MAG: ATP-binding cassette domain-containing protein, partial [Oscillospiraceae bacterium]
MVLLTGESLNKTFTERKLLDNTGFSIESGDKIGIIGVNGTGKTTLLRILAGEETLDSGNIIKMSGLRIGYLPQNPNFTQDNTILQQVMEGIAGEAKEYECKS